MHGFRPELTVNDIPIFVYHTIDAAEFESHLRYLAENRYQTIDCDTYVAILKRDKAAPERAVMITIDDGRASVGNIAVPLLEKFQMQAVVFLIPGYVRDRDPAGFPSGNGADRDPDLMTWDEIEAAQATGTIDFQSHTLFHHRVPVSDRLQGFVMPTTTSALFDIPVAPGAEPPPTATHAAFWGYPIFPAMSRMTGQPAFLPDPALVRMLQDEVSKKGTAFFDDRDWQGHLNKIVTDWRDTHGNIGRQETVAEAQQAIVDSLVASRVMISDRLPGKTVRHLCLPYNIGSQMAFAAAAQAGFESCFWGLRPDRRCNTIGDDPMFSVRLKGDFLTRLPGRKRGSIPKIIAHKILRRLSGAPVY